MGQCWENCYTGIKVEDEYIFYGFLKPKLKCANIKTLVVLNISV